MLNNGFIYGAAEIRGGTRSAIRDGRVYDAENTNCEEAVEGGGEGGVNARMRYRKKRNGGEDGRRYDGNKRSFAWCDHGSLSGLPPRETLDSGGSLTTFGNDMAGPRVSGSSVALQKVLSLPPSFQLIGQLPFAAQRRKED